MKAKVEPVHDSNIYKEANNNVDVKPSINNISTSDTSSTTAVTGTSSYVNAQMSMIDSRRAVADELDDPFLIAQPCVSCVVSYLDPAFDEVLLRPTCLIERYGEQLFGGDEMGRNGVYPESFQLNYACKHDMKEPSTPYSTSAQHHHHTGSNLPFPHTPHSGARSIDGTQLNGWSNVSTSISDDKSPALLPAPAVADSDRPGSKSTEKSISITTKSADDVNASAQASSAVSPRSRRGRPRN
jgi:hypothetical protein